MLKAIFRIFIPKLLNVRFTVPRERGHSSETIVEKVLLLLNSVLKYFPGMALYEKVIQARVALKSKQKLR